MPARDILFVLVVYRCTVAESLSYRTLVAPNAYASAHLFVYDNSPYEQTTDIPHVAYVRDTKNGGLGRAYNAAAAFAAKHGYRWLLLMDQDTHFPPNAHAAYLHAAAHPESPACSAPACGCTAKKAAAEMVVPRHRVATGEYMSPTPVRMKTSHLRPDAPTGLVRFRDAEPINSGMMVTVRSFLRAGGYDEAVWLDFSDRCFVERYRRLYDRFLVLPDVVCTQTFSALDTDPVRTLARFRTFLDCARHYPTPTLADRLAMLVTTLRPTLSRTLRTLSLAYLRAYVSIYVLGRTSRT